MSHSKWLDNFIHFSPCVKKKSGRNENSSNLGCQHRQPTGKCATGPHQQSKIKMQIDILKSLLF